MTTLGDGATASGEGESANVRRRGVTDGWLRMAESGDRAGAGEKVCEGDNGLATFGGFWLGTIGCPGKWD